MLLLDETSGLSRAISRHSVLLVLYGSKSCAPCGAIQQKVECWCQSGKSARLLYVEIERFPELCGQQGIFTVPTLRVYVEGKLSLEERGYFGLRDVLTRLDWYYEVMERKNRS